MMRASRVVTLFSFFFMLLGGQALISADSAYALKHCCKNCYTGLPANCASCPCLLRAQAFVEAVTGVSPTEITVSTENSGAIKVEASPDVIKQILDLKEQGNTVAHGDFLFKVTGSENNLRLKCVGFAESEADPEVYGRDPSLKRNKEEFEKTHPKGKKP